jgi:3-dehydroquinate synthetase
LSKKFIRKANETAKFKIFFGCHCFLSGYRIQSVKKIVNQKTCILLTDENVFKAHRQRFKGWNVIVLKSGEDYKIQPTIDALVAQLIEMEADRSTTLVGVGGGVVTDITGYLAAVYMRGFNLDLCLPPFWDW